MNWDAPLINGFPGQPFISKENFKLYSINLEYEIVDFEGLSDSDVDQPPVKEPFNAAKESFTKPAKIRQNNPPPHIKSLLTCDQHKLYLDLCSKFRHRPPATREEQKELNTLKELQEIVLCEQSEFMKYLRNLANHNANNYLFMSKNAQEYLSKFLVALKNKALRYPQFYVLLNAVSLSIPNSICHNTVFQKMGVLLEMGKVSKMILPNLGKGKCMLSCDMNKISQMFPFDNSHHIEVDKDPNINKLAAEFEADIAMSYSTFECLFDNHAPQFNRQWELPVIVKKGTKGQKLVIMGDHFVSKNMSVPEKNQLFYDLAVKSNFLHPKHQNHFNLETWNNETCTDRECIWDAVDLEDGEGDKRSLNKDAPDILAKNDFDMFDGDNSQLTNLEQGIITEPKLNHDIRENKGSDTYFDLSDSENLVIDIPGGLPSPIISYDGQNDKDGKTAKKSTLVAPFECSYDAFGMSTSLSTPKTKIQNVSMNKGNPLSSNKCTNGLLQAEMPAKRMRGKCDDQFSQAESAEMSPPIKRKKTRIAFVPPHDLPARTCEGYEKPKQGNVYYILWKIGSMKILLKDSYLGYLTIRKFGSLVETHTKLEYQKAHGFEQLTLSELARIWLSLYMKPAVKEVYLCRVDAFTSEVLKIEKITKENLNYNFQKCFAQLEIILKTCAELDIGSYLLSHTKGNAHFQIKNSTNNKGGAYNLHLAYKQPEITISAQETFEKHWMPIDLNVQGRFVPVSRIPCTFEPRDIKRVNNVRSKKKT